MTASLRVLKAHRASTTVAYRPFTALTYYILWLSSALSTKCAVLIHYATVVLTARAPAISHAWIRPLHGPDHNSPVIAAGGSRSSTVLWPGAPGRERPIIC